jgi:hypothetical protein
MHTPGPWHKNQNSIFVETHIHIASGDENWLPHEEQLANAALIAAAPDLLRALRDIVCCARIRGPAGTTGYLVSDDRIAAANDAIKKAFEC